MCGKLDPAADRLEIGAHHVHADAAPGNRRHLVLGGEAGFEDEIEPLEFGEFVQFALGSRTVLDEAADKLVGIDAAAVAEEFDDDLIARLTRRYGAAAVLALARGAAAGGGFAPVLGRVAEDVAP